MKFGLTQKNSREEGGKDTKRQTERRRLDRKKTRTGWRTRTKSR